MDFAHRWLLAAALLIIASILAGKLSSRVGAPLLLVFLGLGMVAGEEGLGGIGFGESATGGIAIRDVHTAYLIGSAALTLILLDGGIRTRRASFRLALWPSLALATFGVVITAAITGLVAAPVLGMSWLGGFLVGAILASTDAAAVFLLLHQRGGRTSERLDATLEVESGINDPVAVFLTASLVGLIATGASPSGIEIAGDLAREMGLGLVIGAGGGVLLLRLVNRLDLAAGLYPILVLAGALAIFAGTQLAEGSGYLAVYLTGIILGNARLRAARLIGRFIDGMAWLAQIVLFLMLGLFVSPSSLLSEAGPALVVALALMLVARPVAVWLCLTPFRFTLPERAFIAWVGLRGAVPIFLAMFPLLAGLPGSASFFNVAFIAVLASLALQGWTVAPALRWLGLELPAVGDESERLDFDLPAGHGREVAVYRVAAGAPALAHDFATLPLPPRSRVIAVLREGVVQHRESLERLLPRDLVFAIVPPESFERLDRLFATGRRGTAAPRDPLGDLPLDAAAKVGEIADLYGLPAAVEDRDKPLAGFMRRRLHRSPSVGDRIHFGGVDLVVRAVAGDRITEVGLDLEPRALPFERLRLRTALRRPLLSLRRLLRRRAH
ncbi:MAG TPA: potassium/proton antiporter [Stellaceae bacterium]|nr:potassium/proton antiporter [Stellaceae bacterium]